MTNTEYAVIAASAILLISLSVPILRPVYASPYSAGYDHGCDDAKISNADDRYINQPDKGPNEHTSEFMSGYNAGFSACGYSSGGGDNSGSSGSARHFEDNPVIRAGCALLADPVTCETARGLIHGLR